jgi:hypothetical protein
MLRFLLISSISRKWKSCCQGFKRIANWRISYPAIALAAHIYISLHIVLILCDCKHLTALHSSPRVSYEHARSPIQTAQAVFGCKCLLNDRSDENISSIHRIFVCRSNEKRCRQFNHNLSENLCSLMLVREQNHTRTAMESRYCFQEIRCKLDKTKVNHFKAIDRLKK